MRVIIDTNIWISSLIGRQLSELRELLSHPSVELIVTERLMQEVLLVAQRPKLAKYFSSDDVDDLREWMEQNMTNVPLGEIPARCRDPKDDYLLELAIRCIHVSPSDRKNAESLLVGKKRRHSAIYPQPQTACRRMRTI